MIRYALNEFAKNNGIKFEQPRNGDAGYDLYANEDCSINPNDYSGLISTGVHVEIPDGFVGIIKDRSSIAKKGLHIAGGVIDSSYRGEIKLLFHNSNSQFYDIFVGDKIAQLIIVPVLTLPVEQIELRDLSSTNRGTAGFGSTGSKL